MPERIICAIRDFLKLESASGILLMTAMALAMVMNNSALDDAYQAFIAFLYSGRRSKLRFKRNK